MKAGGHNRRSRCRPKGLIGRPESVDRCMACAATVSAAPYVARPWISLFECLDCGSLTALPRPSPEAQIALHDNADYFRHPYFEQRRAAKRAIERRCHEAFVKIGRAISLNALRGERHLDVG